MLFLALLVLLLVLVTVTVLRRPKKLIDLHQQIKLDSPYVPIIGHSYIFIGTNEDRMTLFDDLARQAYKNKYGMVSYWLVNQLYVCVSDSVSASIILKTFFDKWPIRLFASHLLGNGILLGEEHIWRPRRKILAPMFSTKYYNNFVQVFEQNNKILVEELAAVVGKGDFSPWDYFSTYSLDSALDMTFGENVNAQRQLKHPFVEAFKDYCKNFAARICQPWLYSDAVYKLLPVGARQKYNKTILWEFVENLINKKKKAMSKEELNKKDDNTHPLNTQWKTFLELLIEFSGGEDGYTGVELREETLALVLAATDTAATGGCFALMILSHHPQVQDRVFEEIQRVLGNSDRSISVDDLINLKYLDAVVKETLRLFPPIPLTIRNCDKDLELPSGLILREGCSILLNIRGIHRNPHHWGPDANEFNPDRFLNVTQEQLTHYMPFAFGLRGCPGMRLGMASLKLALAEITRRYRIRPATSYQYSKQKPIRLSFDMVLKHVDDYKVQFENRC